MSRLLSASLSLEYASCNCSSRMIFSSVWFFDISSKSARSFTSYSFSFLNLPASRAFASRSPSVSYRLEILLSRICFSHFKYPSRFADCVFSSSSFYFSAPNSAFASLSSFVSLVIVAAMLDDESGLGVPPVGVSLPKITGFCLIRSNYFLSSMFSLLRSTRSRKKLISNKSRSLMASR